MCLPLWKDPQVVLLWYIVSFYFLFWFYEYWLQRMLGNTLIEIFQKEGDFAGQATYSIRKDKLNDQLDVSGQSRIIQIHGGARIVAIGWPKEQAEFRRKTEELKSPIARFHFYEYRGFLQRLRQYGFEDDENRKVTILKQVDSKLASNRFIFRGFTINGSYLDHSNILSRKSYYTYP